MPDSSFVVVGGGLAGAKAVEALREQGYDGALTLVGAEKHLPYERPPLSKGYLAGSSPREEMDVHDAEWYGDNHVELLLGTVVADLDPAIHAVTLDDGRPLRYDKLLLATGSRPRTLSIPGSGASGVATLRNVEDSERISAAIQAGQRLALIGGGWIGMEIAANAREGGSEVTVLETAELPLLAVLGPELARVFLDLHREHGVGFHLGAQVAEITTADAKATGVRLADGTAVAADLVLVGVGASPNVELAVDAGLDVDNGVLVDEALQTSDADIVAVGDIANQLHPVLGRRVRVEHWANALNQPAAAAATMMGNRTPYTELPYFFTDQYDLGMEYVGYAPPGSYSRVVTRGDVAGREFLAFWLDDRDRVVAGMNVNIWDVVDDVKALILSRSAVDVSRLADPDVALSALTNSSPD
jgi:3-phenylpropionate/trans-cinnamate dioxygenase ferredoxin reductase subunit